MFSMMLLAVESCIVDYGGVKCDIVDYGGV